jgi:enamine deaminase RidA (YjgF/YER057c/UK114 family)
MNEIFHIIIPKSNGSFEEKLDELFVKCRDYINEEKVENRGVVMARIFLSDPINQFFPILIKTHLYQLLSPNVSIVGQTPLDCSKVSVLLYTSKYASHYVFNSYRLTTEESECCDAYQQSVILFNKYLASIEDSDMKLERNCVRTWIYVRDIDLNYSGVVKARNDIFKKHQMTTETHFIASTGIGGESAAPNALISIDFLSVKNIKGDNNNIQYLEAVDYLNPTHEYGVAFERGTRLKFENTDICYISGTASIDNGGNILYCGDVLKQADRLLINIQALLKKGESDISNAGFFIVYLRDISDYNMIKDMMNTRFPNVPTIIVEGRVCRPGWLIEMECMVSAK